MSHPVAIFLILLLVLLLLSLILAAWILSFRSGPELWGACAGVCAGSLSAALSYFMLRRALSASNLSFLKAYFAALALRLALLFLSGLIVWAWTGWSLWHYMIAVALSYPLILFLEAWCLSRDLPGKKGIAASGS